MHHQVQQLCDRFSDLIIGSRNIECEFSSIDCSNDFNQQSLVFVSDQSQLHISTNTPAVIVTCSEVAELIADDGLCVIEVADVRLAQAMIKQHYADYDSGDAEWDALHSSAVIHSSAKLGNNVRIGPNVVIGENVVVGDNSIIRANSVIEHDAIIGQNTIINSLVNIGYGCVLGNDVIISPGVVIGSEGFGFAHDKQGNHHRIPHTGIVEIQDNVQAGSNCNIDRATYGKTIIRNGVKLDAMCHIAHNVEIDEGALLLAQTGIAGSSKIGKRAVLSGQTAVSDHVTIGNDVVMVHRCGAIEDITKPGVWAGTPARPFKEYVRNLGLIKKINKLSQEIRQLKKN